MNPNKLLFVGHRPTDSEVLPAQLYFALITSKKRFVSSVDSSISFTKEL